MNRRSFLKVSSLTGGGMLLSFNWFAGYAALPGGLPDPVKEWMELNSYIKITKAGEVLLMSPNPEFGSNVKTSMPMILADELDIDWKQVVVEQADFYPERFDRQFTGGSQGIRSGWKPLRKAGATARQMLVNAAAQTWNVPAGEITTEAGMLMHVASGKKAGYGEMAALAATLPVPKEVRTKAIKDFDIIGRSQKNVEGENIVMGKPLFGMDFQREGMVMAMVVHPPSFGMKLGAIQNAAEVKKMPGVKEVFTIQTLKDDYERNGFDTTSWTELVVIAGSTTWELMQAKKALKVQWEKAQDTQVVVNGWGGKKTVTIPAGLESSEGHLAAMQARAKQPARVLRKDGDPEAAFARAAKILERTYTCPFLAHNCMEPVNCFADVRSDRAEIYGPTQAPDLIRNTLAARLGLPKEKIQVNLARMGGGFGLRAYGHHMVEAAVISQHLQLPVKMIYTREDDMTYGIYRPAYMATYRAALDEKGQLIALHINGGGVPESPIHENRFPAGAVDNYLAEGWEIDSNITIGAFRAPRSNFNAAAEQSFLDELAELMGKDPIDFRLDLLARAKKNPVGKNNDYDADRYAGVLELVREKSGWGKTTPGVHRGVSAYFCHNSYVAEVVDMVMKNGKPWVQKVHAAVDCGIVINPDAAANMCEGAIVDAIGNAFYGELPFKEGAPQKNNFHNYRMIRNGEAPKSIEVHFVQNEKDPTGLGEPPFPPMFAAVANALYKATKKRYYKQPFAV
jgi:isoquinoline 1-oxidoreductase beta subunit